MLTPDEFEMLRSNLTLKHQATVVESWRLMVRFLDSLQKHHLLSADSESDREMRLLHNEIANLHKLAADQYKRLLDKTLPNSQ